MSSYSALLQELAASTRVLEEATSVYTDLLSSRRELFEVPGSVAPAFARREVNDARDDLYAAVRAFEDALAAIRGEVTRVMVEEEGLSVSKAARAQRRSRQFTARMWVRARAEFESRQRGALADG